MTDLYTPSLMFTKEEYQALLRQCIGKRRVLEFGPGTSTFAFIAAGCEEIHTCEYSNKWIETAERKFAKFPQVRIHKFENVTDIAIAELIGKRFDLAFVDSPRGITDGPSRLNTLKFALERTDKVILHDANRKHEQMSIELLNLKVEKLTPKLWLLTK